MHLTHLSGVNGLETQGPEILPVSPPEGVSDVKGVQISDNV